MRYMVDMTYPPSHYAAEQMRAAGYTACAVYVGGPRATAGKRWQQIDGQRYPVRDLAGVFEGFLPIYVGRTVPYDDPSALHYEQGTADGDDANACAGACGFDSWTPLALDMEYGTYQANNDGAHEYVRGWVERVNGAGHPAGIYSDIETLNTFRFGFEVDFKWGAAWVRGKFPTAPVGQFDPSSPPPWEVWQFGGATIGGVAVDCNSARDDFKFAQYG